jgi:hypothetical protein
MNRVEIAFLLSAVGLIGSVLITIFLNLYHKWKKNNSFLLIENTEQIILKNNPVTIKLGAVAQFLLLSVFSFITATNEFNFYMQLIGIYAICILISIWGYNKKRRYQVMIEKGAKTMMVNTTIYSLTGSSFEIAEPKRWWWVLDVEGTTSYGLYLKNENNKYILLYGYSIYKDIENLKEQLLKKNEQ